MTAATTTTTKTAVAVVVVINIIVKPYDKVMNNLSDLNTPSFFSSLRA